jgi:hypothetical protein
MGLTRKWHAEVRPVKSASTPCVVADRSDWFGPTDARHALSAKLITDGKI